MDKIRLTHVTKTYTSLQMLQSGSLA